MTYAKQRTHLSWAEEAGSGAQKTAPVMAEVPRERLVASTAFASAGVHYFCPFTEKIKKGALTKNRFRTRVQKVFVAWRLTKLRKTLFKKTSDGSSISSFWRIVGVIGRKLQENQVCSVGEPIEVNRKMKFQPQCVLRSTS